MTWSENRASIRSHVSFVPSDGALGVSRPLVGGDVAPPRRHRTAAGGGGQRRAGGGGEFWTCPDGPPHRSRVGRAFVSPITVQSRGPTGEAALVSLDGR